MSNYTFDDNTFSDLYKDAYGYPPSLKNKYYTAIPSLKQKIWDQVLDDLDHEFDRLREHELRKIKEFEEQILSTMEMGAPDRLTAIRWLVSMIDHGGDHDYVAFKLGIPYTSSLADEIKIAMH